MACRICGGYWCTESFHMHQKLDVKPSMNKCHRLVYDWDNPGKYKWIDVDHHSFAWSGAMPCTGRKKCIYCHEAEEDMT